ncbi:S8 family peptidase [Lysobacter niastensis]|uniref:S8 family serine peptidase n=1 Tax=Lysobacter niastensis TaxID=380629 RepID=A0ABS0B4U4_9GAMM|nr:S8 family peptidase [Lysobacter niastensis]MBF6023537.1 S8 family serine peptidase [Lysobacter niastensis]
MKLIKQFALMGALGSTVLVAGAADVSQAVKRTPRSATGPLVTYTPDRKPAQTHFNRFIVKYKAGAAARSSAATVEQSANAAAKRAGLVHAAATTRSAAKPLAMSRVRRLATGAEAMRSSRALDAKETAALLAALRSDPSVAYAQPDYFKYKQDVIPNDPRFADLQWDFTDPVAGIGAPAAWDGSTGDGVVVAVIDTGYVDHRDLNANIVPGYDFISWYGQTEDGVVYPDVAGDGDGRDADAHDPGDYLTGNENFCGGNISSSSWHGTHVAGTIAAVTNNAVGVAGVAYGAKVQPVRVLGHCGGLTSDIADGLTWASGGTVAGVPANPTPAEVVNMSLGGGYACSEDPATQDAINGALSRGVSVVVAAGNANVDVKGYSPAGCSGVITVGATGIDGGRSYFSNYGAGVALSAPGGNATSSADGDTAWIWSLGNSGATTPVASPGGDVLRGQIGTSMAAPHVAGVVALMQSASVGAGHAPLTPDLVKAVLRAKVKPFAIVPPVATPVGSGIVDAPAAVAVAIAGVREEDLTVPLVNRLPVPGQSVTAGGSSLYSFTVPAGVRSLSLRSYGGTGDVSLYVARNVVPTTSSYLMSSARLGNAEAMTLTNPAPGTYYLRMVGVAAAANVTVLAAY